jgi:hypothetical protein
MILRDFGANRAPEIVAGYLIEAPVNPTEDACIIDIIGDLLELRVS